MDIRLTLFFSVFSLGASAQSKPLVITPVTVITMREEPAQAFQTVIITGDRITAMGPAKSVMIPKGAKVINGRGKFLIPGLWDMHVHLSYYGETAFPQLLAWGVTGVRDLGGNLSQLDQWRNQIGTGSRLGPRIFRAGPFVDGPKKMNALRASFTQVVTSEFQARQLVDSLQQQGVNCIKVHSRLPRAVFFAVADEAQTQRIPLVVHMPKDVTVQEASDAGVSCIEHTESFLESVIYESDEQVRESQTKTALQRLASETGRQLFAHLAQKGIWVDPTLIALYRSKDDPYALQLTSQLVPVVTALHQAGVKLLTGTDFAWKEAGIRPGIDLHAELELLVKAGLTPMQSLQAATRNAAACLHQLDDLGTVEPGKLADLLLLKANPLNDIKHTQQIEGVVVNGKYLSKKTLQKLVPVKAPGKPQ